MGLFSIAKVADYNIKQGDTELITFKIKGFDLSIYAVKFRGICQNGEINKTSSGGGITVSAYNVGTNSQDIVISLSSTDTKTLQGNINYEVQISEGSNIYTIIEGRLILSPEIVKI
jgi:hypothetical protein